MASIPRQGENNMVGGFVLPTKILENNKLSDTSEAHLCFVQQRLSANLQAFLVDYVRSISGAQSVYA